MEPKEGTDSPSPSPLAWHVAQVQPTLCPTMDLEAVL
jgi:hypothetical protein